ncbi:unnamed protein product [Coffea canephora]|uniref:Uncharacterized protein n=2 Tax=Coffea TaxID=13442 RepID=A0A068UMD6_COFCA|nr:uncharacterized protein LOC113722775 [Coffea arabica]CDP09414.1 unnamed protein product [Coffea canephora]
MAMHLRRNLGKYFTPVGPFSAGFAGSSTARSGASARATALLPARRQFSSWSATHLKREFHELMAEFKELSFSDCLQLTIGTCVFACAVQRTLCDIKEFTKSACSRTGIANLKFSDKRDGGGTDCGGGRDGV